VPPSTVPIYYLPARFKKSRILELNHLPQTAKIIMAAKRVLHIEDNSSNRKAVQHIFRMVDYQLLEAVDGETGLELVQRQFPDLILLDIQLPGISGYEVASQLKADERTRQIPIIAITSYALNGDERKVREAGCDDYIAKPYRPKTLLDMLEKHLVP